MKYTCSIQKVSFFPDQFEEKGEIDSNGAIEAFQAFPFAGQFEEAAGQSNISCPPSITFSSEDNRTLTIYAHNDKGFYVQYITETHHAEIYISNNFDRNPGIEYVEDFIEYFFKGEIESHLKLQEREFEEVEAESESDEPVEK